MFELVRLFFTDVRVFVLVLFFGAILGPIIFCMACFAREIWKDFQ